MKTKVKIVNRSNNVLPEYKTALSAGLDVCAYIDAPITLEPMQRCNVPTGIYIEMPAGVECQVRSRSGLAHRNGVIVLNAPGTVDADYRGEIGVPLINLGQESFTIHSGDRIAQLVFARHEAVEWDEQLSVDCLSTTERGDGGFGHTGVK